MPQVRDGPMPPFDAERIGPHLILSEDRRMLSRGILSEDRRMLRRGAYRVRNGERLVGAVEEFDGHENHLLVAQVLEVVHLELAKAIGLVAGLAGRVAIFDGGAVMDMLASTAAGDRGPEII